MALSQKREVFCAEYLVDFNATQAAIRAGYSPRSATVTGSRLLADANIQAKIRQLAAERSERTEVSVDDVVKGLHEIFVEGLEKKTQVEVKDAIQAAGILLRHLEPIPEDADALRLENARLRAKLEQYEIDNGD